MTALLDSNVLIALSFDDHIHNEAATAWFQSRADRFATCPSTQGSLVRAVLRTEQPVDVAVELLDRLVADQRHDFWPDDIDYRHVRLAGVRGQRQVTDAYLAQLARRYGGRLATFDKGLAVLHPDVAERVPTGGVT